MCGKHWSVASHTCSNWELNLQLRLCPDWESDWWPFTLQNQCPTNWATRARTNMTVSYKVKHTTSMWPRNCTLGDLFQGDKNLCLYKCVEMFIAALHNIKKLDTTWMPLNRWIVNKLLGTSMPWSTILSNKKVQTVDTRNNLDESPDNWTHWKKANAKRLHTVWFHLYNVHGKRRD